MGDLMLGNDEDNFYYFVWQYGSLLGGGTFRQPKKVQGFDLVTAQESMRIALKAICVIINWKKISFETYSSYLRYCEDVLGTQDGIAAQGKVLHLIPGGKDEEKSHEPA